METPSAPKASRPPALAIALGVTVLSGAVLTWAFDAERAGKASMLAAVGGLYLVLGALTLLRLHRRGELGRRFWPARGDITLAAATAGVLYGGARIAGSLLAPVGSPRELWVMRVYIQLGAMPERKLLGLAVFVVAALEELVWRGGVMRALADEGPESLAVVRSTLLYAAAHLPTLILLRVPGPGSNPLVVLAALGAGLAFALLHVRTGRLLPPILAHALFTWSVVEFPLWQPGSL